MVSTWTRDEYETLLSKVHGAVYRSSSATTGPPATMFAEATAKSSNVAAAAARTKPRRRPPKRRRREIEMDNDGTPSSTLEDPGVEQGCAQKHVKIRSTKRRKSVTSMRLLLGGEVESSSSSNVSVTRNRSKTPTSAASASASHEYNKADGTRSKSSTPTRCVECGNVFNTKNTLAQHMNAHRRDRGEKMPFHCTIPTCDRFTRGFTQQGHYNQHMKTHAEPEYECLFCTRRIRTKHALITHMHTNHIDEHLYWDCLTCGVMFRPNLALSLHPVFSTFACFICGKKMDHPKELERHHNTRAICKKLWTSLTTGPGVSYTADNVPPFTYDPSPQSERKMSRGRSGDRNVPCTGGTGVSDVTSSEPYYCSKRSKTRRKQKQKENDNRLDDKKSREDASFTSSACSSMPTNVLSTNVLSTSQIARTTNAHRTET